MQLDDLIVLLQSVQEGDGVFGCSVNPRNENLVRAREFLEQSTRKPLQAGLDEQAAHPRSRSAKLRVMEKL